MMRTIQGIEKWLRNRAQLKLIKPMIQEVKRNTQKTKDYQNKTGRNQTIRQRLDKIQEKCMLQKL